MVISSLQKRVFKPTIEAFVVLCFKRSTSAIDAIHFNAAVTCQLIPQLKGYVDTGVHSIAGVWPTRHTAYGNPQYCLSVTMSFHSFTKLEAPNSPYKKHSIIII